MVHLQDSLINDRTNSHVQFVNAVTNFIMVYTYASCIPSCNIPANHLQKVGGGIMRAKYGGTFYLWLPKFVRK